MSMLDTGMANDFAILKEPADQPGAAVSAEKAKDQKKREWLKVHLRVWGDLSQERPLVHQRSLLRKVTATRS